MDWQWAQIHCLSTLSFHWVSEWLFGDHKRNFSKWMRQDIHPKIHLFIRALEMIEIGNEIYEIYVKKMCFMRRLVWLIHVQVISYRNIKRLQLRHFYSISIYFRYQYTTNSCKNVSVRFKTAIIHFKLLKSRCVYFLEYLKWNALVSVKIVALLYSQLGVDKFIHCDAHTERNAISYERCVFRCMSVVLQHTYTCTVQHFLHSVFSLPTKWSEKKKYRTL